MSITNLLDAVRVVKENERIAAQRYAEAAQSIKNSLGQKLFMELSEFEKHHLHQITVLEKTLQESGEYINYTGKAFPLPPKFEITAAEEPDRKSVMKIITDAIALERNAEKAYAELAGQIDNPLGHRMFMRLSEEEHNHSRILTEAYWTLNDLGIWRWTRL